MDTLNTSSSSRFSGELLLVMAVFSDTGTRRSIDRELDHRANPLRPSGDRPKHTAIDAVGLWRTAA